MFSLPRALSLALLFLVPNVDASINDTSVQEALKSLYTKLEGDQWKPNAKQGWVDIDATSGNEVFVENINCDAAGLHCNSGDELISVDLYDPFDGAAPETTLTDKISALVDLQRLAIRKANLISVAPEVGQLSSLQELDFSNSENLVSVPDSIGDLLNLQKLYLYRTGVTALPESLGQLKKLERLNLYLARMESLPESISALTSLKYLNLRYNQRLTVLPESMSQLENLETLELEYSGVKALPKNLSKLLKLKKLDLSFTKITVLPENFGDLVGLENLRLVSTSIVSFPQSFSKLSHLKSLQLFTCKKPIPTLPAVIMTLTSLESLSVSYCGLSGMPDNIGNLTALKTLWFNSASITELPASFTQLTQLEKLGLPGNKLTAFPTQVLGLTKLKELNLNYNAMHGPIPEQLINLTDLDDCTVIDERCSGNTQGLHLKYNALLVDSPTLQSFIGQKSGQTNINDIQALPIAEIKLLNFEQGDENTRYTLRWSKPEFAGSNGVTNGFVVKVKDISIDAEAATYINYVWVTIDENDGVITWQKDAMFENVEGFTIEAVEVDGDYYTATFTIIHGEQNVAVKIAGVHKIQSGGTPVGYQGAEGVASPEQILNDFDGDGVTDNNDDFPRSAAAALDTDEDGQPDTFLESCNRQCQEESSLVLDPYRLDATNTAPVKATTADDSSGGYFTLLSCVLLMLLGLKQAPAARKQRLSMITGQKSS